MATEQQLEETSRAIADAVVDSDWFAAMTSKMNLKRRDSHPS
jgi:hypothetical protein